MQHRTDILQLKRLMIAHKEWVSILHLVFGFCSSLAKYSNWLTDDDLAGTTIRTMVKNDIITTGTSYLSWLLCIYIYTVY